MRSRTDEYRNCENSLFWYCHRLHQSWVLRYQGHGIFWRTLPDESEFPEMNVRIPEDEVVIFSIKKTPRTLRYGVFFEWNLEWHLVSKTRNQDLLLRTLYLSSSLRSESWLPRESQLVQKTNISLFREYSQVYLHTRTQENGCYFREFPE